MQQDHRVALDGAVGFVSHIKQGGAHIQQCGWGGHGCHTVFSPLSLRSRNVAALINAKWLKAWGVLPRCRAWLSNSSAYNPSGLA